MMATALIHLDSKQKRRLTLPAKKRGKSFSQEVRDAVDLYLFRPKEHEEELAILAKAANHSMARMIKNLDQTIANVDGVLREWRKHK
jgi:predicted secreted Zn-dependent protease